MVNCFVDCYNGFTALGVSTCIASFFCELQCLVGVFAKHDAAEFTPNDLFESCFVMIYSILLNDFIDELCKFCSVESHRFSLL